jgi:hypothetical protein
MKKLKESKEIYDHILIPKELEHMVTNTLNEHQEERTMNSLRSKKSSFSSIIKYGAAAAAVILFSFTTALNTNKAFAESASKVPVIGGLAKVLTIRSYTKKDGIENITVKVPAVDQAGSNVTTDTNQSPEGIPDTANEQFVADVNAEIEKIVNDYTADAKARCEADKKAFLATGGTEEEWAKRDLNIKVDYQLKYQQGSILSFVLTADESWYGAYDLKYYYNLDLKENKKLTLEDVLGEDYKNIAEDSIKKQMTERVQQNSSYVYWGIAGDDGSSGITGFTGVDENTKFYMNEEGKPVICFAKYEIAPGFMGEQEFVIE